MQLAGLGIASKNGWQFRYFKRCGWHLSHFKRFGWQFRPLPRNKTSLQPFHESRRYNIHRNTCLKTVSHSRYLNHIYETASSPEVLVFITSFLVRASSASFLSHAGQLLSRSSFIYQAKLSCFEAWSPRTIPKTNDVCPDCRG
jgi:hypothetical protein